MKVEENVLCNLLVKTLSIVERYSWADAIDVLFEKTCQDSRMPIQVPATN